MHVSWLSEAVWFVAASWTTCCALCENMSQMSLQRQYDGANQSTSRRPKRRQAAADDQAGRESKECDVRGPSQGARSTSVL